jgi:predicted 3-demethylubiquinone-9 3-methyltransferase (glyoxalase superfamily)
MQKITPCLWFEKNNAEEAMNFYTSIFKNSKIVLIQRYPEGVTEGPMAGMGGKVLTSIFEIEGQRFMCLDGGPLWTFNGSISFQVECEDQAEVDHYWGALSADPASEQCGWLKDKFGLSWQIIPKRLPELLADPDKEKSGRVLQAMLKMKKIDVGALEGAFNGT